MGNFFPKSIILFVLTLLLCLSSMALAEPISLRWTGADDPNPDFDHVLQKISEKSGIEFRSKDFELFEDRDLAHFHFSMKIQRAGGLPIQQRLIRIWTDRETGQLVQMEAWLEDPTKGPGAKGLQRIQSSGNTVEELRLRLSSQETMNLVKAWIEKFGTDQKFEEYTGKIPGAMEILFD